jgi:hypothetical protein
MRVSGPAMTWLRAYRGDWLRHDLAAGITLAAYLLPAGLGDASLAGLPPEAGLYACLFSGLVFWLFCSSRHTVITVTPRRDESGVPHHRADGPPPAHPRPAIHEAQSGGPVRRDRGILASAWLGLEARGVTLLGEVPEGLPALGLPALRGRI